MLLFKEPADKGAGHTRIGKFVAVKQCVRKTAFRHVERGMRYDALS